MLENILLRLILHRNCENDLGISASGALRNIYMWCSQQKEDLFQFLQQQYIFVPTIIIL